MGFEKFGRNEITMKFAIGLDLGGTFIKGCIISPDGEVLKKESIPTGSRDFNSVCNTLHQFAINIGTIDGIFDAKSIIGMGIGSPGGIYNDRGTISQSPNFPTWKDENLKGALEALGHKNVIVENDANLAAFGESTRGRGKEFDDMAMFTLGTGVGGGLILNRKIWRGTWGMAGELGHITINPDGPVCGCGNYGCLEAYTKTDAIIELAIDILKQNRGASIKEMIGDDFDKITPKIVYDAAIKGDTDCKAIYGKIGEYVGIAIADLLNVLNIPLFVIGGGISGAFALMEQSMYAQVKKRAFREPANKVSIRPSMLGNESGMLGAAELALKEFRR